MSLNISRYRARPTTVNAVRVTEDNLREVAAWCSGVIQHSATPTFHGAGHGYEVIEDTISLYQGFSENTAKVGDWVIEEPAQGDLSLFFTIRDEELERDFEYCFEVSDPDQLELDLNL